MKIEISERDVYKFFGQTFASRGDAYVNSQRVLDVEYKPSSRQLTGLVQGSDREPYTVTVALSKTGLSIYSAECTCPMGGICKHAAALVLHSIREGVFATGKEKARSLSPRPVLPQSYLAPTHRFEVWAQAVNSTLKIEPASEPEADLIPADSVLFILSVWHEKHELVVETVFARRLKSGTWGRPQIADIGRLLGKSARYVSDEDQEIAKLIVAGQSKTMWTSRNSFPDHPDIARVAMERLLASGRCFWKELSGMPLTLGQPKEGRLQWEIQPSGRQILRASSGIDGDIAVIGGGFWYVDPQAALLGQLKLPVSRDTLKALMSAPVIEPSELEAAARVFAKLDDVIPRPLSKFKTETVVLKPVPKLKITGEEKMPGWYMDKSYNETDCRAIVSFDYGGVVFPKRGPSEVSIIEDDTIKIYKRDVFIEAELLENLKQCGLTKLDSPSAASGQDTFKISGATDLDWLTFSTEDVPFLRSRGWQIEYDKSFPFQVVIPEEEWDMEATEGSDFWFSLTLDVEIDGKKEPLLPIIHSALWRLAGNNPMEELELWNNNGFFYAPLSAGRYVALPFDRVKAIVTVLLQFFDRSWSIGDKVQVTLPQLMALSRNFKNLGYKADWLFGDRLKELFEKVCAFEGLPKIVPPSTFKAELRPYQLESLSWLDFLREFKFGGILADDMGLGKTVQTLAHIAYEKANNRLDKPYLVICPTSVLPNWLSEIEKFTPSFKVTALSGPQRSANFHLIEKSDIVITTYPLIFRDVSVLKTQSWKAVVLDEAQVIKNPDTRVADSVCQLEADYRLCLTGTPVQNHLGDLWSQFHFLMPGLLKDIRTFTREYRKPIEKKKDTIKEKILAEKVRPFLLRRTKELVAKELPPKTVIIKNVELEGKQRDLYETVRLAMVERLRTALEMKGLSSCQIVILDALLKLRQVCCDPRLVPLPAAESVPERAKLDALLEMLEELLAEGKKILLFSQFTSMLDLVIPELHKREIEFVEIRGSTKDRATPVREFQAGEVPLFLLSLKAGGTGLNLTAADTVIHFDPWWNPAVENQATDRAHRIGQDKPVFVFKMIATGTIEERMLQLQERKQAIADGMYGDENATLAQLTAEDLDTLFMPIGDDRTVKQLAARE